MNRRCEFLQQKTFFLSNQLITQISHNQSLVYYRYRANHYRYRQTVLRQPIEKKLTKPTFEFRKVVSWKNRTKFKLIKFSFFIIEDKKTLKTDLLRLFYIFSFLFSSSILGLKIRYEHFTWTGELAMLTETILLKKFIFARVLALYKQWPWSYD